MTIPEGRNWQDDDGQREVADLRQQIDQSEGRRIHAHLTSYLRTVTVWQGFANSLLNLLNECEHNEEMRVYAITSMRQPDPRDSIISALDVAGHDVVDTGSGMKERAPDRHDGWCQSSRHAGRGPFHAPP